MDFQPTPLRVSIDPKNQDKLVEVKRLVGFDGWLSNGGVTVEWYVDEIVVASGLVIAGSENEFMLADPIVFKEGKHWIRPAFTAVEFTPVGLSLVSIIEVIPV